jgi:hypothetical protein
MVYTIVGEPQPYRDFKHNRSVWCDYKEEQVRRAISLENQHGDRKVIGGAIKLDVVFSFDVTKGRSRKISNHHTERPTLEDLVRYINILARDRIYIPESVVAINACKRFSIKPCTELTITKLEKE